MVSIAVRDAITRICRNATDPVVARGTTNININRNSITALVENATMSIIADWNSTSEPARTVTSNRNSITNIKAPIRTAIGRHFVGVRDTTNLIGNANCIKIIHSGPRNFGHIANRESPESISESISFSTSGECGKKDPKKQPATRLPP
jgi:hypothetical protein